MMVRNLFMESVEQAVDMSVKENRILVVYSTSGDDRWLESWFSPTTVNQTKNYAVWLRLVKDTEQFGYFEAIFPNVSVPSLYLVKQGKVVTIIKDNDSNDNSAATYSYGKTLCEALGIPKSVYSNETKPKSLKEQIEETTQQKYHEELLKQRKIDQEERERILKLVQADKAERKALQRGFMPETKVKAPEVHDNIKDMNKLHTRECTLLIRLTNGSTLTKKFNSQDTLNDVRRWVDFNRTDGDCPYSFHRNIPRITFPDSDELKSLESLELLPRSALILKPLDSANERINITDAKGPGLLGKVFGGISSWWNNGYSDNDKYEENKTIEDENKSQQHPTSNQEDDIGVEHKGETNARIQSSPLRASIVSEGRSTQATPSQRTNDVHIRSNVSELSLPSRCVTPNVYQFVNKDDDNKETSTYNGNNTSLGKSPDEDKAVDI